MKYFHFARAATLCDPLDVIYADYLTTFLKKMDVANVHSARLKKFPVFNHLRKLSQVATYILDRERGYGIEDLIESDKRRVPICLKSYNESVYAEG